MKRIEIGGVGEEDSAIEFLRFIQFAFLMQSNGFPSDRFCGENTCAPTVLLHDSTCTHRCETFLQRLQLGSNAREHSSPIARGLLPEETHCRIPGRIFPVE